MPCLKTFSKGWEGTLRAILKQAGISPDDFLNKKWVLTSKAG